MYELKEKDENIWALLDIGGFSVNKFGIPFTAIGSDHGNEQENHALKVIGGIKGIANSEVTLNEYFLTAVEMGNIVNNFCETFGIDENQSRKRDEYRQLTGSKNARIETNCTKLSHVFNEHDVTFERQDSVYNIFTRKVLPMHAVDRFLQAKEIGQTKYEEFVKKKLEGERRRTYLGHNKERKECYLRIYQQSFHCYY